MNQARALEVLESLRGQVSVAALCVHLGVARSAWYRSANSRQTQGLGALVQPERPPVKRPTPLNALSSDEKAHIRETLNSARYADLAIPQAHTAMLEEGVYLASVSTMYRIMREYGEVRERRNQTSHAPRTAPVLCVTEPNTVYSWDITKMRGGRVFYCLYVVLDIFSRYVVGWLVSDHQSAKLAGELIAQAMRRQGLLIGPDQTLPAHALTLLSDNGGPMIAKDMVDLMSDLCVRQVHSRPHVPNDNPYSESQFRTLKYRPSYPSRFDSLLDARGWCQTFFEWYNHQHYHSGIAMLTPATVHYGRVGPHLAIRQHTLALAFDAHPDRFHYKMPILAGPPKEVWLNRPGQIPGLVYPRDFTKL